MYTTASDIPSKVTFSDTSGIRATPYIERPIFDGRYLTTYQYEELEEQSVSTDNANIIVVKSPSWPDFVPIAQDSYLYECPNGDQLYIFEMDEKDLRTKWLNCNSTAKLMINYNERSFYFCQSVSRRDKIADMSLITAKILNPQIKSFKIKDYHLGKALKSIDQQLLST